MPPHTQRRRIAEACHSSATVKMRLRYSGTSLGYQLASIIAGGPPPFIATSLLADHTNRDISAEYLGV